MVAHMNAEALRAHHRDRRGLVLQPLAPGAVAQGRDLRPHPARDRDARRLRPGRRVDQGRAGRAGRLPHRAALVLLPRGAARPGAAPITLEFREAETGVRSRRRSTGKPGRQAAQPCSSAPCRWHRGSVRNRVSTGRPRNSVGFPDRSACGIGRRQRWTHPRWSVCGLSGATASGSAWSWSSRRTTATTAIRSPWFRSAIPSNSLACVYGIAKDFADQDVLGDDVDIDIHAFDEANTTHPSRPASSS